MKKTVEDSRLMQYLDERIRIRALLSFLLDEPMPGGDGGDCEKTGKIVPGSLAIKTRVKEPSGCFRT